MVEHLVSHLFDFISPVSYSSFPVNCACVVCTSFVCPSLRSISSYLAANARYGLAYNTQRELDLLGHP